MNKWIWLDMDGTIANFYGVENWLEYLMEQDETPYRQAKPLYNTRELVNILNELKMVGYNIGVISWLSKTSTEEFDNRVTQAKKEWLQRYELEKLLDEIIITSYGNRKSTMCQDYGYGVLVDDEEQNLQAWNLGETINATKNIIKELERFL